MAMPGGSRTVCECRFCTCWEGGSGRPLQRIALVQCKSCSRPENFPRLQRATGLRERGNMISVVIPTWNAASTLAATLTALVPAVVDGVVREVLIVDCGSSDATCEIADAAGARIVTAPRGRGEQLRAGGEAARQPWLLFLHADTVLETDWQVEASKLIEHVEAGTRRPSAAAFRFALDDVGLKPRLVEWGVSFRCAACALPYGDQGLLISRPLYEEVGGFRPLSLFEDVDLVGRLGRRRLTMLRARAATSAARYRQAGYANRVLRNVTCLVMYQLGASPERLEKIYYG